MRRLQRVALLSALLTGLPAAAAAQDAVGSFERLRALVEAGDSVTVTTIDGTVVRGRVSTLSPSALELVTEGTSRTFAEADVRSVSRKDSPWNGMLWGLAAGAAFGAVAEKSIADHYNEGSDGSLGVLGGAAGAGIGFLLDAIGGRKVIFSASPTRAGIAARVSLGW